MCRWMGSHFREWIDYNGVAHFRIFGVRQFFIFLVSKCTRMFVLQMKSKVFFINFIIQKMDQLIKIESDLVGIAKITIVCGLGPALSY